MLKNKLDADTIPSWHLYGEEQDFPDVLHCEKIIDRASGLDWIIAPHRHTLMHQFLFMREGLVTMSLGGRCRRQAVPFVASLPRGLVHEFRFSDDADGYVLTMPLQNLPEIFAPQSRVAGAFGAFFDAPACGQLAHLFDALYHE